MGVYENKLREVTDAATGRRNCFNCRGYIPVTPERPGETYVSANGTKRWRCTSCAEKLRELRAKGAIPK